MPCDLLHRAKTIGESTRRRAFCGRLGQLRAPAPGRVGQATGRPSGHRLERSGVQHHSFSSRGDACELRPGLSIPASRGDPSDQIPQCATPTTAGLWNRRVVPSPMRHRRGPAAAVGRRTGLQQAGANRRLGGCRMRSEDDRIGLVLQRAISGAHRVVSAGLHTWLVTEDRTSVRRWTFLPSRDHSSV